MHSQPARRRTAAALAAAFLACAPAPALAADGQIRVDLRESVGADWFSRIGDRSISLERIDALRPTPANLQNLDVPELKRDHPERFVPAGTAMTSGGAATFAGLDSGVYLLSVADNPGAQDKRVSYAPFVVALTPNAPSQAVAPKAQELGIAVDPLTACNAPAWKDAAAPGTYVEYDFVSTVPNVSTDGTLGTYALTLAFSRGHTVQWERGGTRSVLAQGGAPLRFDAVAEPTTATRPGGGARRDQPVNKLQAPRLTARGAGETVELTDGEDYEVSQRGNDEASFTLTDKGRATLARLKRLDAATTVDTWVPAKANTEQPWGSGPVRDTTLGDLEATATLNADGMDVTRDPVQVQHVNHINVVRRDKCFEAAGTEVPGGVASTVTETETATGTAAGAATGTVTAAGTAGATVTEIVTHETTRADGSPAKVTETVVRREGGEGGGTSSLRERVGNLAYTGASVIGITGIALVLIILGFILRRRDGEEKE